MAGLGYINLGTQDTPPSPRISDEEFKALKANTNARLADAPKETSKLGDYVRTFGAGVPEVGGTVAEIGKRVGLLSPETANSIQENAAFASARLRNKTSKSFQEAASQPLIQQDESGTHLNPNYSGTTLTHDIVASALGTIATGIGAGALMKVGGAALSPILSRLGMGEAVAAHFPKLASLAETIIPGSIPAAEKVNKMLAMTVAAKGGASASEGLVAAGQNAYQKRQEIEGLPLDKIKQSPEFNSIFSSLDPSLPLDQREALAHKQLAEKAGDDVFKQTFLSTGGLSLLTGGGALGDLLSKGKITSSLIKTVGKEAGKEFIQEFPQSGMEQLISNSADKKYVDPNKSVWEGVLDAAAKGGITGGVTGGAMGSISHLSESGQSQLNSNKKVDSVVDKEGNEHKITTGPLSAAYTKFNKLVASNPDISSDGYKEAVASIKSSINNIIKPGEGKEVDPIKNQEATLILESIDYGHSLLEGQAKRDEEDLKEKVEASKEVVKDVPEETKPADSSESAGTPVVPQAPVVPQEPTIPEKVEAIVTHLPDIAEKLTANVKGDAPLVTKIERVLNEQSGKQDFSDTSSSSGVVDTNPAPTGTIEPTTKQPASSLDQVKEQLAQIENNAKQIESPTETNVSSIQQPSIREEGGDKGVSSEEVHPIGQEIGASTIPEEAKGLEELLASKTAKLQAIVDKTKNGEEVDWNADWEQGTPIATLSENRLKAAAGEVIDLQNQLSSLQAVPTKPVKAVKPKATRTIKPKTPKPEAVKVEKGEEVTINATSIENRLPAVVRDRQRDIIHSLPIKITSTTGNAYRGEVTLYNHEGKAVGTKEISFSKKLINPKEVTTNSVVTQTPTEIIDQSIPDTIKEEIRQTGTVEELDSQIADAQAELDIARDSRDIDAIRDAKEKLQELSRLKDAIEVNQIERVTTQEDLNKAFQKALISDLDNEGFQEDDGLGIIPNDSSEDYHFDVSTFIEQSEKNLENIDHTRNREIISKILGRLNKFNLNTDVLEVEYVDNFSSKENWPHFLGTSFKPSATASGFHKVNKATGKTYIFINGARSTNVARTLAHELIGHYGLRKLFHTSARYTNFLMRLLNNSPAFREEILNRNNRWRGYLDNWLEENSLSSLPANKKVMFGKVEIPVSIALRLADEHMAELCADSFMDEHFLTNRTNLTGKKESPRNNIRIARREAWLNKFLREVSAMVDKIFGTTFSQDISNKDLKRVVAASIDNLFDSVTLEHINPNGSLVETKMSIDGEVEYISYEELSEESQLDPSEIVNEYIPSPIKNINAFVELSTSAFADHNETVRSRFYKSFMDRINNSPLAALKAFGNMPYQQTYIEINNLFKGKVGAVEEASQGINSVLKGINSIQNQAIYEYMTTKGADVSSLPITPLQRAQVKKAKDAIRELGRTLSEMGMLDKETFEKNEDAYLHVTYMKYLEEYRGSGKRTSLLSHLRKKDEKTDRERLTLGQIRDVRFLIPETLGVIARDNVLLQMFSTLNEASVSNDLYWTLTGKDKIKVPGISKKVTIDVAHDRLSEMEFIYSQWSKGDKTTFGDYSLDMTRLKVDIDTLKANIDAIETKILTAAHAHAKTIDNSIVDDKTKFLQNHYVRLPNKPNFGALRNQWVRKEIANDLDAITSSYDLANSNNLEKFFARGGTLERINRLWKMSKVALNPASWVRNGLGNLSLLDLSTSTPTTLLIGMLHQEISGALGINGAKESKYWKLANEYGLFGTTFSAIELQDIYNTFGDDLNRARKSFESRTESAWDKQLSHFDERFISILRIAGHKINNRTAKGFALLEGTFKTVAMRDYLQIWEKQNNRKLEELNETERQVLLSKAASHANDSLFDYSQVNSFVKTLRRVPLGAPFITFTYKAGPAAVKAMINHPIKFAKYATLPALLTMIAMAANDWDDKDIDKIKRSLPDYYRMNPGMAIFPFKDSQGRAQIFDMGYLIPWNQFSTAARKAYENFKEDGGESPVGTFIKFIHTVADELGFLGGPAPQVISAAITGKDSFTGNSITTPGTSADQQMLDIMKYSYNLAVPSWISSTGWFSKLASSFGLTGSGKPEVDRFGDIKTTPGQAIADITGFGTKGIDPAHGLQNRRLSFTKQLAEVTALRHKVAIDKNLSNESRASKMRELTERQKIIRSRMQSELKQ